MRAGGSDGAAALRAWVDTVRAGVFTHGWSHVAGLGSLAIRSHGAERALAFSPNFALLEELNGVNVVSADREVVVTAIVRALRDGHDAIELPGLGTLTLDRPLGGRAYLAFEVDPGFAAALQETG